jgi:hypothetical protein
MFASPSACTTRTADSSPADEEGTCLTCWICGEEEAATREHLAKTSDFKAMFGKPSQQQPSYFSASDRPGNPPA